MRCKIRRKYLRCTLSNWKKIHVLYTVLFFYMIGTFFLDHILFFSKKSTGIYAWTRFVFFPCFFSSPLVGLGLSFLTRWL